MFQTYNKKNYYVLFALLLCVFNVFSQSINNRPEFNLNKQFPNAEYRFSFVHISDVHIGEGFSDYGTYGYYKDSIPAIDTSKPANALRNAVNWINNNHLAKNIKFVIVSGDLTGKAQYSEYLQFKNIMSDLEIPYVPIIGNHDVWQYVRYGFEEEFATGDRVLNEVLESVFEQNKLFFDNWNDGTRLTPTLDPETGFQYYFQNYSFEYDGFKFYALDFNPRYHVKKEEPGIGPETSLHDFEGGTFQWFKNSLAVQEKKKENTIIIAHHPLMDNILFILSNFVFGYEDYDKLTKMMAPYSDQLALYLAGHVHIYNDYPIRTLNKMYNIMPARVMPANKDFPDSYFQIVNVYKPEEDITTPINHKQSQKINVYPNPSNDIFNIQFTQQLNNVSIQLFDLKGNKVYDKKLEKTATTEHQIDVTNLSNGVYQLYISSDTQNYNYKLSVNHQ